MGDYDPGTWDMFSDIAGINAWLDQSNTDMIPEHDDSMRVMKIGEELGEAVAAYIGYTGQNPRKGQTHELSDLLGELADVAVTALCAIQHFTGDAAVTRAVMAGKISKIIKRAGIDTSGGAVTPALIPVSEVTEMNAVSKYPPELASKINVNRVYGKRSHVEGPCHCGETHDRAGALARNLVR